MGTGGDFPGGITITSEELQNHYIKWSTTATNGTASFVLNGDGSIWQNPVYQIMNYSSRIPPGTKCHGCNLGKYLSTHSFDSYHPADEARRGTPLPPGEYWCSNCHMITQDKFFDKNKSVPAKIEGAEELLCMLRREVEGFELR